MSDTMNPNLSSVAKTLLITLYIRATVILEGREVDKFRQKRRTRDGNFRAI